MPNPTANDPLVLTAVGAVLATLAAQLPNLTAQFADLLMIFTKDLQRRDLRAERSW
jgi:hypothetical protein